MAHISPQLARACGFARSGLARQGAFWAAGLVLAVLAPLGSHGVAHAQARISTNLDEAAMSFFDTAEENYKAGTDALDSSSYEMAIRYFEYVKNKFPYSQYRALSDLKIAETHFAQKSWLQAADAYRFFVRFYPRHPEVPFASFQVAQSYFNAIPVDNPIFPASHERDQTATRDAISALDAFLRRYPKSEKAKEAKALRKNARGRLARHDMYAAAFYKKRLKFRGALWRYERVLRMYSDTAHAEEARFEAGKLTAGPLEEPAAARAHFARYLDMYPKGRFTTDVKRALDALPAVSTPKPE